MAGRGVLFAHPKARMFKNLLLYRITPDWSATVDDINDRLAALPFIECGATTAQSAGWVPPRGEEHGRLIEAIDGQWLLQLMVERKQVPASVLRRQVDALAGQIEQQTGRKPGKKQQRELKDQALLDLLPMAFAKRASVQVWIAPAERLLAIDASSAASADQVLSLLVDSLPGFAAQAINTAMSPAALMADWLVSGEPSAGFTVDRECELKAADGEKPTVRYARHALDIDEIRQHIQAGKQPTRLAMTWQGRVSFMLTDGLQIKKLAFLDGVYEGRVAKKGENFDADAAIATGELAPLIGDLLDALGGEETLGSAGTAPAGAATTAKATASGAQGSPSASPSAAAARATPVAGPATADQPAGGQPSNPPWATA